MTPNDIERLRVLLRGELAFQLLDLLVRGLQIHDLEGDGLAGVCLGGQVNVREGTAVQPPPDGVAGHLC